MNLRPINKIAAIATILLFSVSTLSSQSVTPWLTSGNKSNLIQEKSAVDFRSDTESANVTITLDPTTTYQIMDGFGFCLTEGSAEVISSLDVVRQTSLLNELFDKRTGLGISVLRISIGASDLSSSSYSYNENSGDVNMTKFSLSGPDANYLFPVLKKILAINPDIKILATPWSAPRWMKTVDSWIGGSLKPEYYNAYANYFVKYLDAVKALGISVWAITPQNEPENPKNEPSMLMNSTEQLNFINNNLGPAMAAAGYANVKIIAFDHNCDNTDYPTYVCNNSSYVDGSAFHLYIGDISAMTTVKNATNKSIYFTEQYTASTGSFAGDLSWHIQNVIVGGANNWAKTIIEWNLANDSGFNPHTDGGCTTCKGAITVDNSTSYSRNVSYYIIGQISKFVKPGAVRLGTSNSVSGNISTAFKNADGTFVLLAFNSKDFAQTFKVVVGGKAFVYSIPPATVATFNWNLQLTNTPAVGKTN